MNQAQFRFQELEIWKRGAGISGPLFRMADDLDEKRLHRFAGQLRGAVLSITNNIAEGSGSASAKDFAHYLNMARRSVFEVANMLGLLAQQGYWRKSGSEDLLRELEEQSRMLLAFQRRLKS